MLSAGGRAQAARRLGAERRLRPVRSEAMRPRGAGPGSGTRSGWCLRSWSSMQCAQLHSGTLTPVLEQVVIPTHLSASREAECSCGWGGKTAPTPVPAGWDTARMAERETEDVTAPVEAGAAG